MFYYTRAPNYDSITSNHALICQVVVTGNGTVLQKVFPVTNNLLDISSDIYMIVQGMIRSDRLKIPGSCVIRLCLIKVDQPLIQG